MSGGAVYTGLLPGRSDDFTILGINYGKLSTDFANTVQQATNLRPTYELVYEVGYRINTTKFSYIQPDLQWILNPGGCSNTPNALVLGVQLGVVF